MPNFMRRHAQGWSSNCNPSKVIRRTSYDSSQEILEVKKLCDAKTCVFLLTNQNDVIWWTTYLRRWLRQSWCWLKYYELPTTRPKPLSTQPILPSVIRACLSLVVLLCLLAVDFGEATVSSVECKCRSCFERFTQMYHFLRWHIYPRDYKNETTLIL